MANMPMLLQSPVMWESSPQREWSSVDPLLQRSSGTRVHVDPRVEVVASAPLVVCGSTAVVVHVD